MTETLVVVSLEMSPEEFLELIPDDGTASYFLPHLLSCSLRQTPTWTHNAHTVSDDILIVLNIFCLTRFFHDSKLVLIQSNAGFSILF